MTNYLKPESLPKQAGLFFDIDPDTSSKANAYLIDPGLVHYRGHHFTLDVGLRDALEGVYSTVNVLCNVDFPAQTGFIPCFRASIYKYTAQTVEEVEQVCDVHGNVMYEDLRRVLTTRIRQDDVLLIPSGNITLLIGLRRWLASLPQNRRPSGVQLHFHTLSTYQVYSDAAQARLNQRFLAEAKQLDGHFKVRWSADIRRLADVYTGLCGFPFLTLKSPHQVPLDKTRVHRHDGRIRLLIIGEVRAEKGLELVLNSLPGILSHTQYCDLRFVVPSLPQQLHAYLLNQPNGRVSLRVEDEISYAEYCDEIAQADYVLCVYNPEQYQFRSSGVVSEAALLNVPVVISRGMAVEEDIFDTARVFILPDQQPASLERLCIKLDKKLDLQLRNSMQTVESVVPLSAADLSPGWYVYGKDANLQTPFDVAVVMPACGLESVLEAVSSVYAQQNAGRIQLLIGVEVPLGNFTRLKELLEVAPSHVTPCLFYAGYAALALDGGALRTTLSYMANARYLAYLDEDNWWAPLHLSSLLEAITGHQWAYALRWFVHPDSRQPVCIDDREPVGPESVDVQGNVGGCVDPNCLMIDRQACEAALRLWSAASSGVEGVLAGDREVYAWLLGKGTPGETRAASVYCAMKSEDGGHLERLRHMRAGDEAAGKLVKAAVTPRVTAITTCKGRLHHLKQTLPLLAKQTALDIVVVDYGCPQGTAAWVSDNYPDVKVVVVTDDPVFNLARARNLGANAAVTPWLLFIDADVLVTDLQDWINHGLQAGKFYMTRNYGTDLTGTFFCMRQIYSQIAGYDEAFRGWGGEDDDMYYRLAKAGQQKQTYPDSIFVSINHDEDERFAEYPDSNKTKQWMVNQWYRNIKYDLMAVRGGDLSLAERIYIRKLATEAALNAIGDEVIIPTELFVNLGENMDLIRLNAWALDRRLIYTVRSRAQ